MDIDMFKFSALETMAANQVYNRFRVNRFEVWMLFAIIGTLALRGRKIMNDSDVLDDITGYYRLKKKMSSYLKTLKRKGMLLELDYQNRGSFKSIAVSPLGWKVVDQFEIEMKKLEKKRQNGEYDLEGVVLGEIPPKYRLLKPIEESPDRVPDVT